VPPLPDPIQAITACFRRLIEPHPTAAPKPPSMKRILKGVCPHVVPDRRDINAASFVKSVREDLRPTLALAAGCVQIFGKDLLAACGAACNFHNALLPKYRGLRATGWAVYYEEKQAGFTFHYMNERIDDGPILLQEAVPILQDRGIRRLDGEVLNLAAGKVSAVLDLMIRGDPGVPQRGTPSYFGRKAIRDIRRINRVSDFTRAELERRLRAFIWLDVSINGRVLEVTRFVPARSGGWVTADGVRLRPTRFLFLPRPLYEIYRLVRRTPPI